MAITTLGQEVGRSNKAHAKRLEAVAAELQNKTTVLDARVTAVTEDLSRGTKKLRADAEDQTRIVNSRFDKFTTDTKVNLASKVQDALDRLGPVEAAANEARQTAVALTLLKMEVDELKQIPKELQRIEDKIEDTADERDARVSEIEVDMAVLQATSQAV
jgi:FtsZ-binding cell division protein ZapB